MMNDRRVKLIEKHLTSHQNLDMKKLELDGSADNRPKASLNYYFSEMFKCNEKYFLRRFIIADEIWIHNYIPEIKKQSKQWTKHGRRSRQFRLLEKVRGIILIGYLLYGSTIAGKY